METLLGIGGVIAFLFGLLMAAVGLTATDIQLGFGVLAMIGGLMLMGMSTIIARLPPKGS